MTTEKAIELLHKISDSQFDGPHGDERREALEMAVRALEGDGDTIYRQQAIDEVVSAMIDGADAELVEGVMELLPSAQPERKTARWEVLYPNHTYKYHCSGCGANHKYMFDFCPSCGARMDGESDEML